MAMTEHVDDPAAAAAALSSEDPLDKAGASEDEVPEGAVLFKISESDIANVLAEQSLEVSTSLPGLAVVQHALCWFLTGHCA